MVALADGLDDELDELEDGAVESGTLVEVEVPDVETMVDEG